jgi:hypothetical protein
LTTALRDRRPATLALADGTVYRGHAFGAATVAAGEVCFNTSMTGYQEIVTDPSYAGQIVAMTYTQIGNVGANPEDDESPRPFLSGFVVKELFHDPSNWRSRESFDGFLARWGVPGIAGIDTRALVRRIRDGGFQVGRALHRPRAAGRRGAGARRPAGAGARRPRPRRGGDHPRAAYRWSEGLWGGIDGQIPRPERPAPRLRVVAYDFGVKRNILRLLVEQGFDVTVVPATTSAAEVLRHEPDAVFLSNGPGRPGRGAGRARAGARAGGPAADVRHLPRAPDPGPRAGRDDAEAQVRPSRRQPARAGPRHEEGGDLRREPRLRGGGGVPARRRRAGRDHPRQPERRHRRGPRPRHAAAVLGAVPPGGVAGPARRRVLLRPLPRDGPAAQARASR